MRLSISNISWDPVEDIEVSMLLKKHGIDAIDVAPGKYFPDVTKVKDSQIEAVKNWWMDREIQITGMQSLLFGTVGLNLFGSTDTQKAMLSHLAAICRIGAGLKARKLVFGSPKNRDRTGIGDKEATQISVRFFKDLAHIASSYGVTICLEPNPACYGANFMTTCTETARIVESVAHDSVRMQLDTGALTINDEAPDVILHKFSELIGHIHLSEPYLVPLCDSHTDHIAMNEAIAKYLPEHVACIEILAQENEPHLSTIDRSIQCAKLNYCNDSTNTL